MKHDTLIRIPVFEHASAQTHAEMVSDWLTPTKKSTNDIFNANVILNSHRKYKWHFQSDLYSQWKVKFFLLLFFKIFGGHKFFLWGHWHPCFELLVTSALGFKARVDSLIRIWRRRRWKVKLILYDLFVWIDAFIKNTSSGCQLVWLRYKISFHVDSFWKVVQNQNSLKLEVWRFLISQSYLTVEVLSSYLQ